MKNLEPTILEKLQAVIGLQLTAVQQHFIHVLILQERNDHKSAAEITRIDSVDLPIVMQLVERLVADDIEPRICQTVDDPVSSMPAPGFSDESIHLSEIALEAELTNRLKLAAQAFGEEGESGVRDLLVRALDPRAKYLTWLHHGAESETNFNAPASDLSASATHWINGLFANLMIMISQELVHAFVHLHAGNRLRANAAWEISGAAMMQAAQITRLLANQGAAPAPHLADLSSCTVYLPVVALESDQALQRDQALARHCVDIAESCKDAVKGTEFETVARESGLYLRSVAVWRDGDALPDIPNPCRDFQKTLDVYVRPSETSRRA